jgi:hypothetical protein
LTDVNRLAGGSGSGRGRVGDPDALKNGTSENAPKYNQAALKKVADLLTSTAKA